MDKPVDHNSPESQKEYFDLLGTITLKGRLYRKYFLYPRINNLCVGKTLDVGCGKGDFISYRKGSVGVDINPFCVDYCKKKDLEAYHCKDYNYPFESQSFDSVLLDNVLEHLEEPNALLKEIHRVIKTSGYFVIGVPSKQGFRAYADHKVFYDLEKLNNRMNVFATEFCSVLIRKMEKN